jgi:hypothetical protein
MNKEGLERMFRAAGLKPEKRLREGDYDIFIGDGFSPPPHVAYLRFGVEPTDYSFGCYVTFYWIGKDEKLYFGRPLFFEAFHDPNLDLASKKKARIAAAVKDARREINRAKMH